MSTNRHGWCSRRLAAFLRSVWVPSRRSSNRPYCRNRILTGSSDRVVTTVQHGPARDRQRQIGARLRRAAPANACAPARNRQRQIGALLSGAFPGECSHIRSQSSEANRCALVGSIPRGMLAHPIAILRGKSVRTRREHSAGNARTSDRSPQRQIGAHLRRAAPANACAPARNLQRQIGAHSRRAAPANACAPARILRRQIGALLHRAAPANARTPGRNPQRQIGALLFRSISRGRLAHLVATPRGKSVRTSAEQYRQMRAHPPATPEANRCAPVRNTPRGILAPPVAILGGKSVRTFLERQRQLRAHRPPTPGGKSVRPTARLTKRSTSRLEETHRAQDA